MGLELLQAAMKPVSTPLGVHDSGDIAAYFADADRAIALYQHQLAVQILETQDIDENGNVWCLDCPTIIPAERLSVMPYAVRCAGCQEEHEHRQFLVTGKRRI